METCKGLLPLMGLALNTAIGGRFDVPPLPPPQAAIVVINNKNIKCFRLRVPVMLGLTLVE
jgi:hypothetical protein